MCLFVFTLVWFGFKKEKKKMCVVCVLIFSILVEHRSLSFFFATVPRLPLCTHILSFMHEQVHIYVHYASMHTQIFSQSDNTCAHTQHTHAYRVHRTGSVNFWYFFYRTQVNSSSMGGWGGGAEQWLLLWQVLQKHHITMNLNTNEQKRQHSKCVCVHDGEGGKVIAGRALILLPVNTNF